MSDEPPSSLRQHRFRTLALFSGPLLFLLLYAVRAWSSWNSEMTRLGDYPVVALQALAAERFELLLGPYSRFRFHHPGPFLSYLHAAGNIFFSALPSLYGRLDLTQFLINSVNILGGLWMLRRIVGHSLLLPLAAWLLFTLLPNVKPSVIADIWGPSTLICPLFAFVLCAADVARGHLQGAWLFLFSACLLGSTHVGTLPVLVVVGGVGVVQGVRRSQSAGLSRSPGEWWSIGGAVAIFALSVLPPVLEAIRHQGGNLVELLVFFSAPIRGHALFEAFQILSPLANFTLLGVTISGVWLFPVVLLLPWAVWRGGEELKSVRLLSTLGLLAALFAATRVRGDLHSFLLEYTVALVALQLLMVAAGVFGPLPFDAQRGASLWGLLLVILLLAATALRHLPEGGTNGDRYAQLSVEAHPGSAIELSGGRKQWEDIANILLLFTRNGTAVCVSQRWIFMFGPAYACKAGEQTDVHEVTRRGDGVVLTPRPLEISSEG